ncbi:MAG: transferase [Frankiales bacterium]|nr:transferase [Frankiales bacterium]
MTRVAVVIPSVGRTTLPRTLAPLLGRVPVTVVDDRPDPSPPLDLPAGVRVLTSGGRGPAAARNTGWRATDAEWIAFLDDDVYPPADWVDALLRDLSAASPDVAGSQGRLHVPLPAGRRPTDWERSTAGLATAVWATADLAYRRAVLEQVGGFDERFPRAYREDADLGLRVTRAGWRIVPGDRHVEHPVRPASWWTSVTVQRGNADDVLMRALHGPDWRAAAHVPAGRRPWHLATTASLLVSVAGALAGRPGLARAGALAWAGLTADFARRRVAPGPRTPHEVASMAVTSAVLPVAATGHWLLGHLRLRALLSSGSPVPPVRAREAASVP